MNLKMRITLFLSLLFVSGWISVSASESHTVEVQSGGDVTLMCSNISRPSCVSSMNPYDGKPSFCDGFQNRFEMSSNISTVFLKIKRVDLSDSGLYFCGFFIGRHTVIVNATYLKVQEKLKNLKRWKKQKQTVKKSVCDSEYSDLQDLGSDELNYAALNFQAKPKRSRRPASERELEPHVVYAATR
uniref:Immunoglobulin domain-containing protein n=1 Tax=Sander lucioperca TaxID=283035 RepID=A0A8C9X346_SANLU